MSVRAPRITAERLREVVTYDPETGVFVAAKDRGRNGPRAGGEVGTYTTRDGMIIGIDGYNYPMHNLAWLWVYGEWPPKQLLKRDGDNRNLAISNLMLPVEADRGDLTQQRLKELLSYDATSGVFVWRVRPAKNVEIGSVAGRKEKSNGHRYISIDGVDYTGGRLAWLYEYGALPDRPLRPLDGDPSNTAISNLAPPEYDTRTKDGMNAYQRDYRKRNFELHRAFGLRKDFGAEAPDVYQLLFLEQNGLCAGCNRPERATRNGRVKWLAIDHCHETHVIRGLLCADCNTTLGKMNDDPARLRRLADYLEKNHDRQVDGNVVRFVKKKGHP